MIAWLNRLPSSPAWWAVAALVALLLLCFCGKRGAMKRRVNKKKPMSVDEFIDKWEGISKRDVPGCYVIMIYARPALWSKVRTGRGYKNIYIGQSVHMYRRVHDHFTGHGNGDVYADIKYGKTAYVRFVPCDREDLNNMEIALIRAYDATRSYNKTRGGAKVS